MKSTEMAPTARRGNIGGPSPLMKRPWSIKGACPQRPLKLRPLAAGPPEPWRDREKAARHLGPRQVLSLGEFPAGEGDKDLAELYSDLGLFYQELGDVEKTNQYLARSVELYRSLGSQR